MTEICVPVWITPPKNFNAAAKINRRRGTMPAKVEITRAKLTSLLYQSIGSATSHLHEYLAALEPMADLKQCLTYPMADK